MKSLTARIAAAEKKINSGGFGRDARLGRVLQRGEFTSGDLDAIYDIIAEPLKASVSVVAAKIRPDLGYWYEPPIGPLGRVAMLIAFLSSDTIPSDLEDCRLPLSVPEDIRHATHIPEFDNVDRARRGLLQRLVNHYGLDSLREGVARYRSPVHHDWPLPVVSKSEGHRVLRLVAPLHKNHAMDPPVVLWRGEDGSILWEFRN